MPKPTCRGLIILMLRFLPETVRVEPNGKIPKGMVYRDGE